LEGFLTHLFDRYGHVTLRDLLDIKLRVREDVYKYEFNTFEVRAGTINAEDFAKSIVSYLEPKHRACCLSHDNLASRGDRIDFEGFKNFKNFMYDNFKDFDKEFENVGIIPRKVFMANVDKIGQMYNTPLTEFQKEVLFDIIDHNGNNRIDEAEYNSILINLKHLGRNLGGRVNSESLAPILDIKKEFETFVDKAVRVWEIINE